MQQTLSINLRIIKKYINDKDARRFAGHRRALLG